MNPEQNLERAAKLKMTASDILMLEQLEQTNKHLKDLKEKEAPSFPDFPAPPDVQKVSIEGAELVTIKGEKGDTGERGEDGRDGEPGAQGLQGVPGTPGKDGKDGRDGIDGRDGVDGKDGAPGKNADPLDLEPLREEIKSIKDDVDRIKKTPTGSSFVISRGAIKLYDLSDSLNGSTKTFALPAFWRVITVHLSSYPTPPRPTVHWTTDASAMTLTFTSEVDETTALATGQTCLVEYAEP